MLVATAVPVALDLGSTGGGGVDSRAAASEIYPRGHSDAAAIGKYLHRRAINDDGQ